MLVGGTSGTILAGALQAAKDLKKGQKCVIILPDSIRNYMTKFVSEHWMEAKRFQDVVNVHNHWWWNHTVAELNVSKSKIMNSNSYCKDALQFLTSNGLSRVPVENNEG